jgi:hypothetical protein
MTEFIRELGNAFQDDSLDSLTPLLLDNAPGVEVGRNLRDPLESVPDDGNLSVLGGYNGATCHQLGVCTQGGNNWEIVAAIMEPTSSQN